MWLALSQRFVALGGLDFLRNVSRNVTYFSQFTDAVQIMSSFGLIFFAIIMLWAFCCGFVPGAWQRAASCVRLQR
jgi:hypothetical protein